MIENGLVRGLGFRLPLVGELKECASDGEVRVVGRVYGGDKLRVHVPNCAKSDIFRVTDSIDGDTLIELDDRLGDVEFWVEDETVRELCEIAEPVGVDGEWCGRDYKYYGGRSRGNVPGFTEREMEKVRAYKSLSGYLQMAVDHILSAADEPADEKGEDIAADMLAAARLLLHKEGDLLAWRRSDNPWTRKEGELYELNRLMSQCKADDDSEERKELMRRYWEVVKDR